MLRIAIIDNEKTVREGLVLLLQHFSNDIELIQEASGISDGLQLLKEFKPNLVFLDVELDEGTSFDILNQLETYDFHIVFITAYNKYAVNAFKFSALDFIQKPVSLEELSVAVQKAKEQIKSDHFVHQFKILNESLSELKQGEQKIVLRDQKSLYFVKVNEIYNLEAKGSYTQFYLTDNRKIIVSKNLKEYESLLEPFHFIRTHQSHLVNVSKIIRLDKTDGGSIVLENKMEIPISQRKWDEVIRIFEDK